VNGPATTAQWLACSGIGAGTGTVVLGLLKLAIDGRPATAPAPQATTSPVPVPPALPTRAPVRRAQHAAPPLVDETQPLIHVRPPHARHAKEDRPCS
jgi:hypothetical protein